MNRINGSEAGLEKVIEKWRYRLTTRVSQQTDPRFVTLFLLISRAFVVLQNFFQVLKEAVF